MTGRGWGPLTRRGLAQAGLATLGLVLCGGRLAAQVGPPASGPTPGPAETTALPPAARPEAYVVGATPSGAPFTFLDLRSDTIEGILVDIVRAVAVEAGFAIIVVSTPWTLLIPTLTAGRVDLIAAALHATPERQRAIAFSDPVYTYGEALVVPAGDPHDYRSWQDLAGRSVGVLLGSAYAEPARRSGLFREVRPYDSLGTLLRDVAAKRLDAGLANDPELAYELAHGKSVAIRQVRDYRPQIVWSLALGLRKDETALRDRINAALQRLKRDGGLEAILKRWQLA